MIVKRCGNWEDVLATRCVSAKVFYMIGVLFKKHKCMFEKPLEVLTSRCVFLHKEACFLKKCFQKLWQNNALVFFDTPFFRV